MEEFRDITFRDGPTGRRAALIGGPDIWEVMFTLKSGKARAKAITATAELLNLTDSQVQTAARYSGTFPDEVDRRIAPQHRRRGWGRSGLAARSGSPDLKLLLDKEISGTVEYEPARRRRRLPR